MTHDLVTDFNQSGCIVCGGGFVMREIKFRGINAETGEWVYGFLYKTKFKSKTDAYDFTDSYIVGEITHDDFCSHLGNGGRAVKTTGFTVIKSGTDCQYTGLKDKNGVEIYEGDIVSQYAEWNETSYISGGYEESDSCETESIGLVSIIPSKGVVMNRVKVKDLIACDDEWSKHPHQVNVRGYRSTVIGNIHQNPELLSWL